MKESYDESTSSQPGNETAMIKQILAVASVFAFVFCGCYNDHPSNEQTFVCTPGGNDCSEGAECIKAGAFYVCSSNQSCQGGCKAPEACVNGTCQCFTSCDDKTCGDDGCGGSCGSCPVGDSWWCDAGTCKDDCAGLKCGESPNLTVSCGTCSSRSWCNMGTCEGDCGTAECGLSVLGINCGDCPVGESWWCDAGTCKDDCVGLECGTSTVLQVSCGECTDRYWCNSGTCEDDCGNWRCGVSAHGITCGTCEQDWWCDSGSCRYDCEDRECGNSPNLGINCGECDWRWWCDEGTCKDDCAGLECGNSPNLNMGCGVCGDGWWCDEGTCKDDCAGLECGNSPNLNMGCGVCGDGWWCDVGTCKDDCVGLVCGTSPHLVRNCGTCQAGWWCNSGTCEDDCTGLECGDSPVLGVSCGSCSARSWCNAGTCEDDCVGQECGVSPHVGDSCGTCQSGWWCEVNVCEQASSDMILIPSGSFWMGCNIVVDNNCRSNESPYHQVTLSGYYMDKTEVTAAAYGECETAGACTAPSTGYYCNWNVSGKEDYPVNCIDYNQSKTYCEWAGKRLPTEAEWEKAARGTDGRKYPWGNETATCDYAVMYESGEGCGTDSTMPVCSKSPAGDSPYGLCDMSGNVLEWMADWYQEDYYSSSPGTNPIGPIGGVFRVTRGGSFYLGGEDLRASARGIYGPSNGSYGLGCRCARSQ